MLTMNEFLKLNWRLKDLTDLEPQNCFITENVIADSLVYKFCRNKGVFLQGKKHKNTFSCEKTCITRNELNLITFKKSSLDEWAHEHCLKALKLFQSGKDPSSFNTSEQFFVDIFKKLKPKIIDENSKYESFVCNQWNNKDREKLLKINFSLYKFGKQIVEQKLKRVALYPQYYKEVAVFNMNFNENESIVDFKCTNNVLELGTLARFSNPNLKNPCFLKCITLPSTEDENLNSKLPVSQDQNIDQILQNFDVDLVISASSLKCITDTSDLKSHWIIPIIVKQVTISKDDNTVTRKMVYLDKPLSQNDISNVNLAHISFKRLIKTNFCKFEAFKYAYNEPLLNQDDTDIASTSSGKLRSSDQQQNKIHHNASYRIWNVKKTDCQSNLMKNKNKTVEFNVLIRSKLDACECNQLGVLQPVILNPKLEMQLKYGANIPTKAELARAWTSLFFTPFSNLYRVRIAPTTGEVICVEKCTIQKISSEALTHYNYKPQQGLGILQKVFEEVMNMEPGKYILQHLPKHEAFIAILQECQPSASNQSNIFDLHSENNKVTIKPLPKHWLPIDLNFILPSFERIKRMPGMFTPKKIQKKTKKKTKLKGKKKEQKS